VTELAPKERGIGPDYLLAGRYRLVSKLGSGGMGAVWLAKDTRLQRDVAIKQVTTTVGLSPQQAQLVRERTLREGRNAAKLSHPHSIDMYDVALESGEPWLVMEYAPSRSMAQALSLTGSIPPFEVAQIGAQIADAMAEAHRAGIIHRDIKPGNILVSDGGRDVGTARISDFGIAKAKGDAEEDSSVIAGTPAYFAPEVARGQDPTEASDVYSLGSTLYTLVEGRPPFGLDSDGAALLHRVARAEIYLPQSAGPLTDVLLAMLTPDPARRPTMAQARDQLVLVAAGAGGSMASLLNRPVLSADGNVAPWAHPLTPPPDRRRAPTPPPLPAAAAAKPKAPANVRDQVLEWAPLAIRVMVAILIVAPLVAFAILLLG
jgi:non-specific serine/threonine protein kinase